MRLSNLRLNVIITTFWLVSSVHAISRNLSDEDVDEMNEDEMDEDRDDGPEDEEMEDGADYVYSNNYGQDNAATDDDDRFAFAYDAKDRIEGDVNSMWNSSPSEWIEEYWEVFGVIALLAFFVFFCLCCVLFVIPCCMENNGPENGRVVATSSEVAEHRKQQHLLKDQTETTDPVIEETGLPASPSNTGDALGMDPILSAKTTEESFKDEPERQQRRKRETDMSKVWNEMVDVWSEFLGLKPRDRDAYDYHRHYASEPSFSRRRKSKSRRRKKNSGEENV